MEYEWDDEKRRANLRKQGLDFVEVKQFDWQGAIHFDPEYIDGEKRERALGFLREHLVYLVYTLRGGRCRLISIRKATRAELRRYGR